MKQAPTALNFAIANIFKKAKFLLVNLCLQGVISIGRVLPLTCQFNASHDANWWKVNICFKKGFTQIEYENQDNRLNETVFLLLTKPERISVVQTHRILLHQHKYLQ